MRYQNNIISIAAISKYVIRIACRASVFQRAAWFRAERCQTGQKPCGINQGAA
jgi:hypothetical protein